MFRNRFINPGDIDALVGATPPELASPENLQAARAQLYGDDLKERMDQFQSRQKDYEVLARLKNGTVDLKGGDFAFRDQRYRKRDVERLLTQVSAEIDCDLEWLYARDRQGFVVHHAIARHLGDDDRRELEERYRFHLGLQSIHATVANAQQHVHHVLGQLAAKHELNEGEFHWAKENFTEVVSAFRQALQVADGLRIPELKNMTAGTSLSGFLLPRPLDHDVPGNPFEGDWLACILGQLGEVCQRTQRLLGKSFGGILALQERLAEEWSARAKGRADGAGNQNAGDSTPLHHYGR
jgi:hypothetical protein